MAINYPLTSTAIDALAENLASPIIYCSPYFSVCSFFNNYFKSHLVVYFVHPCRKPTIFSLTFRMVSSHLAFPLRYFLSEASLILFYICNHTTLICQFLHSAVISLFLYRFIISSLSQILHSLLLIIFLKILFSKTMSFLFCFLFIIQVSAPYISNRRVIV